MKKKLIEVALPLDAINKASAREKSIRHGHPSTLHLWWARRPLATARAVIFSQMVDDPSEHPELFPTEEEQEIERQRLFRLIEELVKWENTTNEKVLSQAREEIWKSWRHTCEENKNHPHADELFNPYKLPAFHDPFAGGGALPLEAQRLGLEAYASDLNPVAVLINKAMIEIPPKFAGQPPVNPESSFDDAENRYRGLRRGQPVKLSEDNLVGLIVKPDIAASQKKVEVSPPPTEQGSQKGTEIDIHPETTDGSSVDDPTHKPPHEQLPKRFHGGVTIDATRMGRDAGQIAEEVISHLSGLVGSTVTVTLEIEANMPSGVPDHVVRIVMENCKALKFTDQGFEQE